MSVRSLCRMSSRSSLVLLGLVVLLMVSVVPFAGAQGNPAIDFASYGTLGNNWSPTNNGFSMGWEFNVLNPITVNRLGYFNYGPNGQGITQSHQVGIFDSLGSLLVTATVNPGDPVQGWFAWTTLNTPYTLAPGTGYRIAGLTGSADLYTFNVASITVDPNIQYVTNRYVRTPTGTLINPTLTTNAYPGYSWMGPNFDVVPEPAILQLPFLVGLGGLAYWRRRRAAKP